MAGKTTIQTMTKINQNILFLYRINTTNTIVDTSPFSAIRTHYVAGIASILKFVYQYVAVTWGLNLGDKIIPLNFLDFGGSIRDRGTKKNTHKSDNNSFFHDIFCHLIMV